MVPITHRNACFQIHPLHNFLVGGFNRGNPANPLVMDGKKDVFKAEVYLARPSSVPSRKTQVTIRLDDDLLDWFRNEVDKACGATIKRGLTWQYEITSD